jgi:DNA-binding transcriptional LysR family regulator
LRRAEQLISETAWVEAAVSRRDALPQGILKVAAPASFGRQHIAPLIPGFLARYPAVRVNLLLNDEIIDIVDHGVDLAIRICKLNDSELVARCIAPDHRVVCASPAYLERMGVPRTPEDLTSHNCLVLSQQPRWTFQHPKGIERIQVKGNFECNNGEVIREMALAGVGIALKATWDVAEALRSGSLQALLPNHPILNEAAIWAVYPSRHNLPAKVTAFVSYLEAQLKRRFLDLIPKSPSGDAT